MQANALDQPAITTDFGTLGLIDVDAPRVSYQELRKRIGGRASLMVSAACSLAGPLASLYFRHLSPGWQLGCHEAAHVVVGWMLGARVVSATTVPDTNLGTLGSALFHDPAPPTDGNQAPTSILPLKPVRDIRRVVTDLSLLRAVDGRDVGWKELLADIRNLQAELERVLDPPEGPDWWLVIRGLGRDLEDEATLSGEAMDRRIRELIAVHG